jgi:glutaredoxin 3
VVIYHSPSCWYSLRALALLQRHGAEVEVVRTRGNPDLRTWLNEVTGRTSVPQVFVGGRSVGGYTDLLQLELDAELGPLLSLQVSDAGRP